MPRSSSGTVLNCVENRWWWADRRGAASFRRPVMRCAGSGFTDRMPGRQASQLCPDVVFVRGRMTHYADVGRQVRAIFHRYTPLVQPLSLDEAFLDVSGSRRLCGGAAVIGREIKSAIQAELGLTASVGIAPLKFVAKIASDLNKPDGFVEVGPDDVITFLDPLPVSRLWGVGRVGRKACPFESPTHR